MAMRVPTKLRDATLVAMGHTLLVRTLVASLFLSSIVVVAACGDDDDPNTACESMCKDSGFSSSRLDQHSHETNCFCLGGSGTVTASACTDMCKSVDKPGSVFRSGGTTDNACQCQ